MRLRIFTAEPNTGIGTHGRSVAEACRRVAPEGIDCEVISTNDNEAIYSAIKNSRETDVSIYFMPHHIQEKLRGHKLYWTVFESSRPNPGYENWLDIFDHLMVPSQWGKKCLEENGIPAKKISVITEGIDPREYYPEWHKKSNTVKRFVMVGKFETRKGYREAFQAFSIAWQTNKNIELHVKADWITPNGARPHPGFTELLTEFRHLPITNYNGLGTKIEMRDLYQSADYFLFPSFGEGWGLPLIEAIACGAFAISCNTSGQSEFLNKIEGLYASIPYGLETVNCEVFRKAYTHSDGVYGRWAIPDVKAMSNIISICAKSELRERALNASSIIRNKYSWDNSAAELIELVKSKFINI